MPDEVLVELAAYLHCRGLDTDPLAFPENISLIGKLNNAVGSRAAVDACEGVSAGTLATILKEFFAHVAIAADKPEDAKRLRVASAHWLRHTHGSHTVAAGVPLEIVQNNLGHASLNTTTIYVTAQRTRRIRAMQKFIGKSTQAKRPPESRERGKPVERRRRRPATVAASMALVRFPRRHVRHEDRTVDVKNDATGDDFCFS